MSKFGKSTRPFIPVGPLNFPELTEEVLDRADATLEQLVWHYALFCQEKKCHLTFAGFCIFAGRSMGNPRGFSLNWLNELSKDEANHSALDLLQTYMQASIECLMLCKTGNPVGPTFVAKNLWPEKFMKEEDRLQAHKLEQIAHLRPQLPTPAIESGDEEWRLPPEPKSFEEWARGVAEHQRMKDEARVIEASSVTAEGSDKSQ